MGEFLVISKVSGVILLSLDETLDALSGDR
jgi:hypothetical protein